MGNVDRDAVISSLEGRVVFLTGERTRLQGRVSELEQDNLMLARTVERLRSVKMVKAVPAVVPRTLCAGRQRVV